MIQHSGSLKMKLAELVRQSVPERAGSFDLYWELLEPNLDLLLSEGVPLKRRRGDRLGVPKLFGSKEGDQVGDLVLAAIGSLAEARKTGVQNREGVEPIVASYTAFMKGLSPFQQGIESFVLSMIKATDSPSFSPSPLGRGITLSEGAIYEVTVDGTKQGKKFTCEEMVSYLASLGGEYVIVSDVKPEVQFRGRIISLAPAPHQFLKIVSRAGGSQILWTDVKHEIAFQDETKVRTYAISRIRQAGFAELADHIQARVRPIRKTGLFIDSGLRTCFVESKPGSR